MRIRVRERQREALLDGAPPTIPGSILFSPPARQPAGFFSYVVSVWLHFLFVSMSLLILEVVPPAEAPAVRYRSKALVIRLPKPESIARPLAEAESARAEDRAEALRKMADQLVVAMRDGKEQLAPEPPAEAGPDGSAESAPEKVETVLIQPQFPLDMQPPPTAPMVPSVLLWPTQLPPAPPENVVVSASGPREVKVPDQPQPVPAVRPSVRKFVAPEDFRPNATVSSVELSAPPVIGQGPTIALLSISNAPMVRDTIVVPPGNIIPAPAKPAAAETNRGSGKVAAAEPPGGGGTTKSAGAGAAPASAPAPVRASVADAAPSRTVPSQTTPNRTVPDTSGGNRTTPAKVAANPAPSPPRAAAAPAATPQRERTEKVGLPSAAVIAGAVGPLIDRKQPAPPTVKGAAAAISEPAANAVPPGRVEHPANGLFDVVIVQNTLDESATGSGNLLHGRPIYTVYLQVGDTKDWILHYCVKDAAVVQRGAVVQLPDPRPVKAPYPRVTYRPAETVSGTDAYVLVHGLIDAAGMLQNLKVVGPLKSGEAALLAALGRWRFRPATRAEEPEPVEMVLAIPIRKS